MLPKINRLKKKKDFERVYKEGKGYKEDFLFLKIVENGKKLTRFGFVVGKNFSKKAALRNQIKRKLREIIRLKFKKIKKGFDAILIIKAGFGEKNFWEVEEIISKLLTKAKILNQND